MDKKFTDEEWALIRKIAASVGIKEVKEKKPREKKERTPEQIEADKERMAKLREHKKKSKTESEQK